MDKYDAAKAYAEKLLADMPGTVRSALAGSEGALKILLDQAFYDGVRYGRTGKGPGE